MRPLPAALLTAASLLAAAPHARAHNGPPYPILEKRVVGPYQVSVWTDPDATDDGTPGGQFWVVVHAADGSPVPGDLGAVLTARPLRPGAPQVAAARPPASDRSVLFARVLMDHEGPWRVAVALDGTLGSASVEEDVEATYDTRPPPYLIAVYALPFVAVAFLWLKAVRSRRRFPPR
jgi:hypothetical protein